VTGVALAVAALIALAVEPWAFAIVAGAVALLAQAELYSTMRHRGFQAATALGLVLGALVMGAAYFRGEQAMLLFVTLSVPLALLWHMAPAPKARVDLVMNVGATLFGLLYVPLLASFILLLLIQDNSGQVLMLSVLGLTIWYDVAAFAIGTLWGSRPLAQRVSRGRNRRSSRSSADLSPARICSISRKVDSSSDDTPCLFSGAGIIPGSAASPTCPGELS
jgi:phosphatidate cytidylyltransferase